MFLFPGQGARNVLAAAREFAPALITPELLEHEGRALERTDVLQPVLTATSLAVSALLTEAGIVPAFVCGHSLGEVAAVSFAGAFDARAAIELAMVRGALMAREAARHPGGLVALPTRHESLELAALNAPDEFVHGGPEDALRGMKRVPVSGAWHTSAMRGAVDDFRTALDAVEPRPLTIPLIRNLDGELTHSSESLVAQLTATVCFTDVLARITSLDVDTVITVGPGLVLRGLLRKNLGSTIRVLTTEDTADVARTIAATRSTA